MQNLLLLLPDSVTGPLLPLLLVGAGVFYILQMRTLATVLIATAFGMLLIPVVFDAAVTPILDKLPTSWLLLANIIFVAIVFLLIFKTCISLIFGNRVADETIASLLASTILGFLKGMLKLLILLVTCPYNIFKSFKKYMNIN